MMALWKIRHVIEIVETVTTQGDEEPVAYAKDGQGFSNFENHDQRYVRDEITSKERVRDGFRLRGAH